MNNRFIFILCLCATLLLGYNLLVNFSLLTLIFFMIMVYQEVKVYWPNRYPSMRIAWRDRRNWFNI